MLYEDASVAKTSYTAAGNWGKKKEEPNQQKCNLIFTVS